MKDSEIGRGKVGCCGKGSDTCRCAGKSHIHKQECSRVLIRVSRSESEDKESSGFGPTAA